MVVETRKAGIASVSPFDFQYYSSEFTYALSYLLETEGLVSQDGTPIGVCLWQCPDYLTKQSITHVPYMDRAYHVIVIDSDVTDLRNRSLWTNVSAHGTLKEVGFWWRKQPLNSNFSLSAFIRNDVLK